MGSAGLRYPDFFIVGAGKAGTTALWRYLSQHPQVFMTKDIRHKELGFFCNDYGVYEADYYRSFFKEATPNQVIGESCHTYLTSPESAELIKKTCSDAKIIIMLRDPVKRAYSLYNWMVMLGNEKITSFDRAVALENDRMQDAAFLKWAAPYYFRNFFYLDSGKYAQQIEPYMNLFGSNCRVYLFEEFNQHPQEALMDICGFLGISFDPAQPLKRENESKLPRSVKFQYYLQNDLRWKLMKLKFSRRAGERMIDFLLRSNTSRKKPVKLTIEQYQHLHKKMEDNIEKTGRLLNKDLNKWWKY